jgi:hypothetical protein
MRRGHRELELGCREVEARDGIEPSDKALQTFPFLFGFRVALTTSAIVIVITKALQGNNPFAAIDRWQSCEM